jgi:hypothetical protein
VGELYLGRSFNTGSGAGARDWQEIRESVFASCCAYCGERHDRLQIEHVIMFNRTEYGLHHPGNCVPVCAACNKRGKDLEGQYLPWDLHIHSVGAERGHSAADIERRKERIRAHMTSGKFALPPLSEAEKHAIRVIAAALYDHVKAEMSKAQSLYAELRDAFVVPPGKHSVQGA